MQLKTKTRSLVVPGRLAYMRLWFLTVEFYIAYIASQYARVSSYMKTTHGPFQRKDTSRILPTIYTTQDACIVPIRYQVLQLREVHNTTIERDQRTPIVTEQQQQQQHTSP